MTKKFLALLLACCLLLPLACASADAPVIERQPEGCDILEGESCQFKVKHGETESFLWRFVEPGTGKTLQASKAEESFPGLKVSGAKSDTLKLKNVPLDLDGWGVFCRLTNGSDFADTDLVFLTVRYNVGGTAAATQAPDKTTKETKETKSTKDTQETPATPVIRAVNGYVQMAESNGVPTGAKKTEIPITGSMDVAVTANAKTVHSWILNGVKYDFEDNVTRIVFRRVTDTLIVEPVVDDNPQTAKTSQEILAARTGETLIVKTINSRMHFLKSNGKSIGGKSFREFDFTNDYTNTATNKTVKGGKITVRVTGEAPENYRIYGWRFNNMRLTFSGEVTFFIVHMLDCSMEYEPLLQEIPIPTYTVNCYGGCSFSGGGYDHATSGTVKANTIITVHPEPGTGGCFTGDINMGTWDHAIISDVTYCVDHDSVIYYSAVIN